MRTHNKTKRLGTVIILDNGGYTAKFGNQLSKKAELIPNCIMKVKSERRRLFIGDQINECRDASGLFYMLPFQRGYVVNWDIQKTVWDHLFSNLNKKLIEHPLCVTEPMFNFQSNQEAMDEIFFEEFNFCGILRLTAPDLTAFHYSKMNAIVSKVKISCEWLFRFYGFYVLDNCKTMLVIDSGYSFTHIVPFINGSKYLPGVIRIDVGGKVLTNHLKEIISYRQLHVMDETYVINQVKEDSCFVSLDFRTDMNQTCLKDKRNKIIREYVLPDYSTLKRGYLQKMQFDEEENEEGEVSIKETISSESLNESVLPAKESTPSPPSAKKKYFLLSKTTSAEADKQSIILNNERITIPEILFYPSDIGIPQMGIPEAVAECIKRCPEEAKYELLGNIVAVGGNTMFPNFTTRLFNEIRHRFDQNLEINVFVPPAPLTYAWVGGKHLASTDKFHTLMISKSEYEEHGHYFTRERFKQFEF